MTNRSPKKCTTLIVGAIATACLGLSGLMSCGAEGGGANDDQTSASDAFEAFAAEAGARSYADLQSEPIPDADNAAILYRQAIAMIERLPQSQRDRIMIADQAGEVRDILDQLSDLIAIALRAGERPDADWQISIRERSFEDWYTEVRAMLSPTRRITKVLILEAQRRTAAQDDEGAFAALRGVLRLREHMSRYHNALFTLTAAGIEAMVFENLETHGRWMPAEELSPLIEEIERWDVRSALRRAWIAETFMALEWYDSPDHLTEVKQTLNYAGDITPEQFEDDRRILLEAMLNVLDALDAQQITPGRASLHENLPSHALVSRLQLQGVEGLPGLHRAIIVRRALAVEAIRLRLYRETHGNYPATWDTPIDPLDGKPIVYERHRTGFTLRSSENEHGVTFDWTW